MKRIRIILFSLLLILGCLLIPSNVLAVPLDGNELISPKNIATVVNQEQSLKNKIAQVEGQLRSKPTYERPTIEDGPWEGDFAPYRDPWEDTKKSLPSPVAIVKKWPCSNDLGKYVFVKNFHKTKSYYVKVRHSVWNINDPDSPPFEDFQEYPMKPQSRVGLGCTVSLGYDGEPSFLHKWQIEDYYEIGTREG